MAGCLDNVRMPNLENLNIGERRNKVAAITAGVLFFVGWWFAIDAAAVSSKENMKDVFHICGVFGTISMFMVNAVSNGQLRGEAFTTGCLGVRGARVWFFLGFLLGFGALIGSCWILFGEYLIANPENDFKPQKYYPGWAIFIQNLFIFISSIVYKFGRSEDLWG